MEMLRVAFAVVRAPLSWALTGPRAALRRAGGSMVRSGHSAEQAKFDTRKWTPALLKHLDWRRFEELCAAYFEALGFTTRISPPRASGNVDISVCPEGSATPAILVRCEPWNAYRVGIKPLRELRAAMTAAGLGEGVLLSASSFTQEAVAFAAKEKIELIDGASLLFKLEALAPEKSLALLKFTTQGDFLTPTCPCCSIKMTSRKSTQGGRKFWGCINYPRCKQTFAGSAPA
jgi:restriction system protein